jgi:hypothetical protein
MTTTTAPVTVTRGNGRAIHAAALIHGAIAGTYCNLNTLMGGRADGRLRRVAGEVTCKSCLKAMTPAPADTPAPVGRPAVGPLRSVRVSEDVWTAATTTAAARGESVSEVIRRALADYATTTTTRKAAR